ncbi:hypothetical protein SELMODRAFT_122869 [Selaginella moellendorffii]|uniref:Protein TPLATE n=1 Tax=Selaginella moellendorffii TaxID=88036 RepID=D8SQX6_SELML|nr:protein TPLATE [Selaginella moellendorffii]EFJ13335.1 hypothetical protein SELMODRAFT_122869 [Selaginella moellendorffii]|eukprot:XP_002985757.1 protein TPLATE [Selaginella moellendorffii]
MDHQFSLIRTDLSSNDGMRQAQALLQALQLAASGTDISSLSRAACEEIIASPASAVCKKLAFDLVRTTRLTADQWETVCSGIKSDFDFPDPDVTAAAVSFLAAIPTWRLGKFITDSSKEISNCIGSDSENLRHASIETLGCLLARDDIVTLCESSGPVLDRVSTWWSQIGLKMLDPSDVVCRYAFEGIGRLFSEFSSKRMSTLAGDTIVATEASVAIRAHWVASMCTFVWEKRDLLMARSRVLPFESFRATIFPLVYAIKAVATGMVEEMQALFGNDGRFSSYRDDNKQFVNAERILGVSDVVSHLVPFLSSLDPSLVYDVGINLLSLADVPGGKPEWASASIMSLLTLWDRQDFNAGRESIVRAVVENLQLLDLHMQVSLFKRLLVMVRNLRAEADRMHALACICRTALSVDLFAKESARRGQKLPQGTDIASLFEDPKIKEELTSSSGSSLFREELVACLVESCFQLSLPFLKDKTARSESRVLGALAYGTAHEMHSWTQSALEVVEVCRPCVRWDCDGRTYAMDCYLKLLVRLCHVYDTRGGVKKVKDGASPEQVLNETRLQTLQRQLAKDLPEVATPRIRARLIWALAEHFDLDGLDPLLADDPEDPLNILISSMHKVLFNVDSPLSAAANRPQDVQAMLLCAQHLGSRYPRASQGLAKELEDFRSSTLADSVNKHQCRLVLQILKYISKHPESRWVGTAAATGDYPFSHHKLSVQYFEASAAQDRKLEYLVHKAVQELWKPAVSELTLLASKETSPSVLRPPPAAQTLSGSSDPCYVEAYHLSDPHEKRLTLHLKVINMTELELNRVDVRVGLVGALRFMDGSLQAVRQLLNLSSQDPIQSSVTVSVSRFERCSLCVQLLYYPYAGSAGSGHDEIDFGEDDTSSGPRLRKTLKPDYGEPIILRCKPYKIPLVELLLPHKCSPVEFFRLWPSLPAIFEFTGAYKYEGGVPKTVNGGAAWKSPFLAGLKALSSKPFHRVASHILRTMAGFQLCYAAQTWYGDFVGMLVFGASEVSANVDLGDDSHTMVCKFILRASTASVLDDIAEDLQQWLDDITDGELKVVSEETLQESEAQKLKRSIELSMLPKVTLAPPPVKSDDDSLLPGIQPAEPSTLTTFSPEEIEHKALQSAVLQEWNLFHLEQTVGA